MVLLTVVVHPIDTSAHPSCSPGFRWAVMVGEGDFADLSRCANAGSAPTREEAQIRGDQCGATAARALILAETPARYGGIVDLDHDPIPAGNDWLNVI